MKKSMILLSGIIFCLTVCIKAQNCDYIIGKVMMNGEPVEDATVEILDEYDVPVTQDNSNNLGYYVLDMNTIGEADYKIIAEGNGGTYEGELNLLSEYLDNQFTILELNPARLSTFKRSKIYFSMSPNPAGSEVNLTFGSENFYTIEFSNVVGKTLLQTTTVKDKLKVDISNFAKGVYFVSVRDNENNFTVKRMVKL